ncbi:ABC transporter permease [Streptomyces sp. NPDC048282]|uniref:ABC transporter permease n=1 Tax=Streptomyces sp. NPDC048282 TaxID=3365528 RepID=UPI0037219B99
MIVVSLRKLGAALITMMISSFVIFGAIRLVPGDPVLALTSGRRLTPDQIEALRRQYGFDRPFLSSYFDWLGGILHGDFSISLAYQSDIGHLILDRLPVTITLMLYSAVLAIVFGFGLGLLAAARGGVADHLSVYVSSAATATPPFLSAVVLLSVLSVRLGWFPALGAGDGFWDRLYHLTLPALALAFAAFGVLARLSRTTFLEQLRREHVEVARSRGVSSMAVLLRHVVRPSLSPVLTATTMLLASLYVGTTVVERAFGINGVGSLLVQSVGSRDMPVVQAIALLGVALFVVTSTAVELVLPLLDPRLRVEAAT